MNENLILNLGCILFLGIGSEWLAWRLQLPSILPLLIAGLLAGPVFGVILPDSMFGSLVHPIVSMSTAAILYEGGLSLNFRELRTMGLPLRRILSTGILINWLIASLAGIFVLGLAPGLSTLLGAIMVITGPTVIGPILKHANLKPQINSILKWDGILNDPLGAMLVVIVYDTLLNGEFAHPAEIGIFPVTLILGILKFIVTGTLTGFAGAALMVFLFKREWVPAYLQSVMSLAFVIAIFLISNAIQDDSGLLSTAIMGLFIANQKTIEIKHIIAFKENLRILLISSLFIILSSRMQFSDLQLINFRSVGYLLVIMLLARPLAVFVSTRKTGLSWQERLFIGCLNPKGVVSVSVAAIVALELEARNYPGAEIIMPTVFFVILSTIIAYSILIRPFAKVLKLSQGVAQGVMIVGAHYWARQIASVLKEKGFDVLLVDTNRSNIYATASEGLRGLNISALSETITSDDRIEFSSLGYLLALTPNDEVNSLVTVNLGEHFDAKTIYQLQPGKRPDGSSKGTLANQLKGKTLFGQSFSYPAMTELFSSGSSITEHLLTEDFAYKNLLETHGDKIIPLFYFDPTGRLEFFTTEMEQEPPVGSTVLALNKTLKNVPA